MHERVDGGMGFADLGKRGFDLGVVGDVALDEGALVGLAKLG